MAVTTINVGLARMATKGVQPIQKHAASTFVIIRFGGPPRPSRRSMSVWPQWRRSPVTQYALSDTEETERTRRSDFDICLICMSENALRGKAPPKAHFDISSES